MHEHLDLIVTLTASLAAALVLGYLTQRLGLSPIVGYLLAGVAVGPNTPGFIANKELAEQLAGVGVILLMFGVGLHFHLQELLAVRRIALPGAVVLIELAFQPSFPSSILMHRRQPTLPGSLPGRERKAFAS